MYIYTRDDCAQTETDCSLKNKVVVLEQSALPADHSGQLFFCTGASVNPIGQSVFLVSLSTGEQQRFWYRDVIGILKPERLPEDAKLQLSQIRPEKTADLSAHEPKYSGYSFLPDGRYAAGVWLYSPQEVMDYVEMQKSYQHRVLICDRDDFAVMEVVDGQTIFPTKENMEQFRQGQAQDGGLTMT